MRFFLIRHAKAVKAGPGEPDEPRPLAPRGQKQARALGEELAAHPTPPCLVLTSPLRRARETAEPIAEATGAELRVDHRLAPGASADDIRQIAAEVEGPVAAVGHQPDCSEIALELTGEDPGFPTAGLLELDLEP